MVVTRTELTQIVEQVNKKFEELESKIKELEALNAKDTAPPRKVTKQAQKAASWRKTKIRVSNVLELAVITNLNEPLTILLNLM
jgi:phage shock protein A